MDNKRKIVVADDALYISEEKPGQLLECANDPCCQEVMEFLKRHPRARFSRLAIVHVLNSHRLYVERALSHLADSGVIIRYPKNNVPFYSLSAEERPGF